MRMEQAKNQTLGIFSYQEALGNGWTKKDLLIVDTAIIHYLAWPQFRQSLMPDDEEHKEKIIEFMQPYFRAATIKNTTTTSLRK